jgi:hypothetical protein
MRMQMRRFTRLTNAFSKKADDLAHNIALHYMHYNFCRILRTLRVTPASPNLIPSQHLQMLALTNKYRESVIWLHCVAFSAQSRRYPPAAS